MPSWLQWLAIAISVACFVTWLASTIGWLFLFAGILWIVVAAQVLVRVSPASLLMAGVGAVTRATTPPARAAPPAQPSVTAAKKPALSRADALAKGRNAIEALYGADEVRGALEDIFAMHKPATGPGESAASVRSGTLIILEGPRGTGKMTVARNLALMLYGAGFLEEPAPLVVESYEAKAVSPPMWFEAFVRTGEGAVGGTLVMRDADWVAEKDEAAAVGSALSRVAEKHPYALTVILVGRQGLSDRIARSPALRSAWLGRFNKRSVSFSKLAAGTGARILADLAKSHGLRFDADSGQRLAAHIEALRHDEGFENAVTVHALFAEARDAAARRSQAAGVALTSVTPADADAAIDRLPV